MGWLIYFGAYTIEVFAASATVLSLLFFLSGVTELLANNLTPLLMRPLGRGVHPLRHVGVGRRRRCC